MKRFQSLEQERVAEELITEELQQDRRFSIATRPRNPEKYSIEAHREGHLGQYLKLFTAFEPGIGRPTYHLTAAATFLLLPYPEGCCERIIITLRNYLKVDTPDDPLTLKHC